MRLTFVATLRGGSAPPGSPICTPVIVVIFAELMTRTEIVRSQRLVRFSIAAILVVLVSFQGSSALIVVASGHRVAMMGMGALMVVATGLINVPIATHEAAVRQVGAVPPLTPAPLAPEQADR